MGKFLHILKYVAFSFFLFFNCTHLVRTSHQRPISGHQTVADSKELQPSEEIKNQTYVAFEYLCGSIGKKSSSFPIQANEHFVLQHKQCQLKVSNVHFVLFR